jgi:hypothetical protein
MLRETITVYFRNHMESVNRLYSVGKMQNFLMLKQVKHVIIHTVF